MSTRPAKRSTRFAAAVAALAIAAIATACGPTPAPGPSAAPAGGAACGGPGGPPDGTTSAIYGATNASRASAGLPPLRWDAHLWCLANEWSKVMGDSNSMRHRNLAGTLYSPEWAAYRTLGENVLAGPTGLSAAAMHDAWMGSPEHRANILSGAYSAFAVAIYNANGKTWATENFGG